MVSLNVLTSSGQVPAGIVSVFPVPDGSANRTDQSHDQQDTKQDQDLHVGHPLHIRALQWRLGGVLGGGQSLNSSKKHINIDSFIRVTIVSSGKINALN